MQVTDKKGKLTEYREQHKIKWSEVLFMGDDIPDYEVMKQVGLSLAPADAATEIKQKLIIFRYCQADKGCAREG